MANFPTPPPRDEEYRLKLSNGKEIQDPYHALEDPDAEVTAKYAQECQDAFDKYITSSPLRDTLTDELLDVINYPTTSLPSIRGDFYYINHNRGLENQSITYRVPRDDLRLEPASFDPDNTEVFFNPNLLAEDGTASLSYATKFTEDGSLWAYGINERGSDWITVRVKDTKTKEDKEDLLKWVKFSSIQWLRNDGFFYSGYGIQDISKAGQETTKQEFHRVFYHKLGTPQSDDIEIFRSTKDEEKDYMHGVQVTQDNSYIFGSVSRGCETKSLLYFKPLEEALDQTKPWRPIFTDWDAEYSVIHNRGSKVLLSTNLDAKNYRLIQIDVEDASPKHHLIEVLPETANKLDMCTVANDKLLVNYMVDATHKIALYEWTCDGSKPSVSKTQDLTFEENEIYTVSGVSSRWNEERAFISITNFCLPSRQYVFDVETKDVKRIRNTELSASAPNPDEFLTEQIKFQSKDGTKVPMFVVRRKGEVTAPQPLLLYGYGGFGIDLMPQFSATKMALLAKGAIMVTVNLRGGGEYGDEWHDAGRREKKQNVFDDFIGAAEHLIKLGYTTKDQIVMQGGSNGGLLVTAVANQRPDLFAGGIAQVPVTDMMRFHKFTIGHAWVPEYGNPDHADDVDFMLAYSPLHTIPKEGRFPSMLVMTADHDDRVVPLHSFKYFAELCYKLSHVQNQNPLMLRVDLNAGHGHGKPKRKQVEEIADIYAFFLRTTQKN